MKKKHTFFNYLNQVFMIYGISNIILNIFALIFGNQAQDMSTLFILGNKGISVQTCFQFLIAMALIVGIEFLFTSDFMIKRISMIIRIILLFTLSMGVTISFTLIFGWFPVNEPLPWIMFILSFILSTGISAAVSTAYERSENKKMAEALKKYKEEQ